ncbi:MAG: hypothetical protein A2W25_12605 [candidate division Zixibacteria bacterium RBG_16_53_22]|nr:MAG: hypothetical protein A2W25_12605 [candidate division Zixibacteria bacterium RBG_16_53_22]
MALGSRRLATEEFGLWTILFALMNFATAVDFGFRYGLGNRLAALKAVPNSDDEQRDSFLAVFHLECLIGLAGFLLFLGLLPWVDWPGLFKIQSPVLAAQIRWLFPLVCGLLMLNQPLTLASTAFFADQQIVFISILSAVQWGLLVLAFWVGLYAHSFPALVLAFFGMYLLCGGGVTVLLAVRRGWRWNWSPWRHQKSILRSFSRPSLEFFALSLSAMTANLIGPFLAGVVGGLKSAGDFWLIQRIFGLLLTLHLALLSPLAPAYTFHARQGDWVWVKNKFLYSVRVVWPLLFIGGGLALFLAHPLLLRLWSGRWIGDYWLAGLLAVSAILAGWANTHSILLNSLGIIRVQVVYSWIVLIPVIVLPVIFGKIFGIYGVALASAVCTAPATFLYIGWVRSALEYKQLNI